MRRDVQLTVQRCLISNVCRLRLLIARCNWTRGLQPGGQRVEQGLEWQITTGRITADPDDERPCDHDAFAPCFQQRRLSDARFARDHDEARWPACRLIELAIQHRQLWLAADQSVVVLRSGRERDRNGSEQDVRMKGFGRVGRADTEFFGHMFTSGCIDGKCRRRSSGRHVGEHQDS